MKQLEQIFGYQPQRQETPVIYDIKSLEFLSASALCTNERITDFKESGFQFHFHENESNMIDSPKLKVGNETVYSMTNYEAAMADYYAHALNLPTIRKGS